MTTIEIGSQIMDRLAQLSSEKWHQAAIVIDEHCAELWLPHIIPYVKKLNIAYIIIPFKALESNKTRQGKQELEDKLFRANCGRDTMLIAIGGGITLDIAGFVGATYLRGIDTVYVPTSLLAMVDASIGGKTGVNTQFGKNTLGAFHKPLLTLIDTMFLQTLAADERRNGMAEVIKHAVIADAGLFAWLQAHVKELSAASSLDEQLVRRAIAIKKQVVEEDYLEQGKRQILNFGHSFAHVFENLSDYSISHGTAVAYGMLLESLLAQRQTGFPKDDYIKLRKLIDDYGFVFRNAVMKNWPENWLDVLLHDKKNRKHTIRMALPSCIGEMHQQCLADRSHAWTVAISKEMLTGMFPAVI